MRQNLDELRENVGQICIKFQSTRLIYKRYKKQIFECLVTFETFAYNYMIIIESVICMQLYLPPFSLAL